VCGYGGIYKIISGVWLKACRLFPSHEREVCRAGGPTLPPQLFAPRGRGRFWTQKKPWLCYKNRATVFVFLCYFVGAGATGATGATGAGVVGAGAAGAGVVGAGVGAGIVTSTLTGSAGLGASTFLPPQLVSASARTDSVQTRRP
jgi:hypothetical protein